QPADPLDRGDGRRPARQRIIDLPPRQLVVARYARRDVPARRAPVDRSVLDGPLGLTPAGTHAPLQTPYGPDTHPDPTPTQTHRDSNERYTMDKRQIPQPAEILDLMKVTKFDLAQKKRRLENALTIEDLRRIAKRRTPAAAFDCTDGAAEGEISMARSMQSFQDIEFHPSILKDVTNVDTSTQIMGGSSALPFGIAPTGFTRLMQTEGEVAGASAAGAAGIPFTLSTLGTTSIEDVKKTNPNGRNWFQLYVMKQRDISYGLVERAK